MNMVANWITTKKTTTLHFLKVPGFETELVHSSNCGNEIILGVFGAIFPFFQDSTYWKHKKHAR